MDSQTLDKNIKIEASAVLIRVILFLVYYFALILLGLALFAGAFWVTVQVIPLLGEFTSVNVRALALGIIAWAAMWWFCIEFAWYLIKPLFTFHSISNPNRMEVKCSDCPNLFKMIEQVARATGNKTPKHVYLTTDVNACVFYNSISIWSVFFPTHKNLIIGTGLLKGMNVDEVKAILGHEFGHFSQQTMKVGTITYRLLLIIRDMIEMAKEQQRQARENQSSENSWTSWFYIASIPIGWITNLTIAFYNRIERKNRSLSRLMEFEADTVSCNTVGAKAFISAMCKLDVLSFRNQAYDNVISALLSDKKKLKEYWAGYNIVYDMYTDDEKLQVSCNDVFSGPVGDNSLFPSKLTILSGWETHPSLQARLSSAKQFDGVSVQVNTSDACDLIPVDTLDRLGDIKQQIQANNLENPVAWEQISFIDIKDFKEWVLTHFWNRRIPTFLYPFVNRRVVGFSQPSDSELAEPVENPFTKEYRTVIMKFCMGMKDWYTLARLKSEDPKGIDVFYDDEYCSDVEKTMNRHKQYLDPLYAKMCAIESHLYKYLWKITKNKSALEANYRVLFFSEGQLDKLEDIHNTVEYIRSEANKYYYSSKGKPFSLSKDMHIKIAEAFWKFMQTFDYKLVSQYCGHWTHGENVTVNQLVQQWYRFGSCEDVPQLSSEDLFNMIDEVNMLLEQMLEEAKNEWTDRLFKAYLNIDYDDSPQHYDDIWDEALEQISLGEEIRYRIADFVDKLNTGDEITVNDIFGEDVKEEEYSEFLNYMIRMSPDRVYTSIEELQKAIDAQNQEPDVEMMKRIAYTYILGNVVEQNLEESNVWLRKAAEMNDSEALCHLGGAYLHGSGVEQDDVMAVNLYKKAILVDGNADALLDLGLAYIYGNGVPRNDDHAASLMLRAARQGNAAAQNNMGYLCREGRGVKRDMKQALIWYGLSAAKGYEQAQDYLDSIRS